MKYRTIVADPPWEISSIPAPARVSEGYSGHGARISGTTSRRHEVPYPTMTVENIAAMPVSEFSAKDAHLYLWTINRFLPDAYDIARAWGFKPSQILTWVKRPKGILFGTFTSTTEFILFCRRGSLQAISRQDRTAFEWPRSNTHSRKPEAFLDLVESVSPGPYLEMFARRQRLGWDTWGDEALEHVVLAGQEGKPE